MTSTRYLEHKAEVGSGMTKAVTCSNLPERLSRQVDVKQKCSDKAAPLFGRQREPCLRMMLDDWPAIMMALENRSDWLRNIGNDKPVNCNLEFNERGEAVTMTMQYKQCENNAIFSQSSIDAS